MSSPPSSTFDLTKRRRTDEVHKDHQEEVPVEVLDFTAFPGGEAMVNAITSRVAAFVNARLATFEQRLPPENIRPALQADKVRAAAGKAQTFAQVAAAAPNGGRGKNSGGKGATPPTALPPPSSAKGGERNAGGKPEKAPPVTSKAKAAEPQRVADRSEWTTVSHRSGKVAKAKDGAGASTSATALKKGPPSKKGKNKKGGKPPVNGPGGKGPLPSGTKPAKPRKIRPPKMAAVLISADPLKGGDKPVALGEAIAGIRSSIRLAEFGIASLKPKKAVGGGLLFEVPGEGSGPKADRLAEALRPLLEPKGVKVTRPVKLAELRVAGLDDSIAPSEVQQAIAAAGGCSAGEVSVGKINLSPAGRLGSVWVRCPAVAAKKVVDAGPLPIGWIKARVEALEARPLHCFKCLGVGHTRAHCKAEVDRSGLCYRCGQQGHVAAGCNAKDPHCPLCADGGHPASHRYGGKACASLRAGKKRSNKKGGKGAKPALAPPTEGPQKQGAAPPTSERPPPSSKPREGPAGSQEEAMDTA